MRNRFIKGVAGVIACWFLGWHVVPRFVDLPKSLTLPPNPGTVFLAADGTMLRQVLNDEGQRASMPVSFEEIPRDLINATLAAEDKRFFSHGGIDLVAVMRAMGGNLMARRVTSGASTITQQLIKISATGKPRSWLTKVQEALQARRLEMIWTKQEIFAAYANRVGYGNLFAGCAAAAQGYFHKPLSDLSAAECAFLAALPQAPGRLNPFKSVNAVQPRQQWVLQRMKQLDMLDSETFEVAHDQPIRLQRFLGGFVAPHAIGLIQDEGKPSQPVIRTTLDAQLQRRIESIIASRLHGLRAKHVEHAAAVVIENATGRIVALVGSRDFESSSGGQINGAWVPHSPGSALKPFTYALAFERSATPASIVPDLPIEYQTPTGLYRPENYDHRYYGPMTYRDALGNSLNVSAVRVLQSVGGAETLLDLLHRLHFSTLTQPAEHYGLGLTIGNAPVRLLELTNAYAALARRGVWLPWTLTQDQAAVEGERVLSETACYLIADILSDNQARVLTFGLHSSLRLPFKVAVKTGTSTNYRDNWTVGFTPEYSVGVWAGNFEGQPMEDVTGVTGAGPIFRDIFMQLNDRQPQMWYAEPANIAKVRIDPRNGKRVRPGSAPPRLSREDIGIQDRLPAMATAADYDTATGAALLPKEYDAWIKSPDNRLGKLVQSMAANVADAWRITSPTDGMVIRLDPDLPDGNGSTLLLRSNVVGTVKWSSVTLPIAVLDNHTTAKLSKGTHAITAEHDGTSKTVHIRVE